MSEELLNEIIKLDCKENGMKNMYETKEHILWWIEQLKKDIAEIDVTSEDYSYEQALEAAIKLQSYLTKLESGEYYE